MEPIQRPEAVALFELPNCIVCMERLDKEIYFLKCGHVFHEQCILNCMELNNKECPMCKKRIQSSKDVNKLFFQVHENTSTQDQIQKIIEQCKQEQNGDMFKKCLAKLRRAVDKNNVLEQKLQRCQKQKSQLQQKQEEIKRGARFIEQEKKRLEREKNEMKREIHDLRIYSSILQGDKQELVTQAQNYQKRLAEYDMYKKALGEKEKDLAHYESMKDQFLTKDSAAVGVEYFCQISTSLKLDVKRLQRDLTLRERADRYREKAFEDMQKKVETMNEEMQRQKEKEKKLQRRSLKYEHKIKQYRNYISERNIEADFMKDQNSDASQLKVSPPQKNVPKKNIPAMLMRKEEKKEEKSPQNREDLFSEFGIQTYKKLHKKVEVNVPKKSNDK